MSTDSGKTWTTVLHEVFTTLNANFYINALAVAGKELVLGTSRGIMLTTDNGGTWTVVDSGLTSGNDVTTLTCSPNGSGGTDLYAGTSSGKVFVSTDDGISRTSVNSGFGSYKVLCLAVNGNDILAGTEGEGLYRSTDSGTDWTGVTIGAPQAAVDALTASVNAAGETTIFAGTDGTGIDYSTDGGATWDRWYDSVEGSDVYALASWDTTVFAGTVGLFSIPAGLVFSTTDGGNHWAKVLEQSGSWGTYSLAVDSSSLIAGIGSEGVFLSTDGGATWKNTCLPSPWDALALAIADTDFYAGTPVGLYCSSDAGTTWALADSGLTDKSISALAVSGTQIFAGTNGGHVFTSYIADNHPVWTPADSGLTAGTVYNFAIYGKNAFAGTNDGVFLSTDNGKVWTSVNTGLTNKDVRALLVSGSVLYAGIWGGGVWKGPLDNMVTFVEGASTDLPSRFSLSQNYPNPFNPTTVISYSIPKAAHVTLTIYNVLGEEIGTLVNREEPTGRYRVDLDGSGLASGIYFYRLAAGNHVITRKMLLLK